MASDLDNIKDEDLLRRMWQETEDFGRKKEIRAYMYKLRESRLKDFYIDNMDSKTSVSKTSHRNVVTDHSFERFKKNEIRGTDLSEIKFGEVGSWNVMKSSENSNSCKSKNDSILRTSEEVTTLNEQQTSISGTDKMSKTNIFHGDSTNFTYTTSEHSIEVLDENTVKCDNLNKKVETPSVEQSSESLKSCSKRFENVDKLDDQQTTFQASNQSETQKVLTSDVKDEHRVLAENSVVEEAFRLAQKPGEVISRKIENFNDHTRMIIEKKKLYDGTVVTTKRYEPLVYEKVKTKSENKLVTKNDVHEENAFSLDVKDSKIKADGDVMISNPFTQFISKKIEQKNDKDLTKNDRTSISYESKSLKGIVQERVKDTETTVCAEDALGIIQEPSTKPSKGFDTDKSKTRITNQNMPVTEKKDSILITDSIDHSSEHNDKQEAVEEIITKKQINTSCQCSSTDRHAHKNSENYSVEVTNDENNLSSGTIRNFQQNDEKRNSHQDIQHHESYGKSELKHEEQESKKITNEQKIDSAHRAFASSLRCATPPIENHKLVKSRENMKNNQNLGSNTNIKINKKETSNEFTLDVECVTSTPNLMSEKYNSHNLGKKKNDTVNSETVYFDTKDDHPVQKLNSQQKNISTLKTVSMSKASQNTSSRESSPVKSYDQARKKSLSIEKKLSNHQKEPSPITLPVEVGSSVEESKKTNKKNPKITDKSSDFLKKQETTREMKIKKSESIGLKDSNTILTEAVKDNRTDKIIQDLNAVKTINPEKTASNIDHNMITDLDNDENNLKLCIENASHSKDLHDHTIEQEIKVKKNEKKPYSRSETFEERARKLIGVKSEDETNEIPNYLKPTKSVLASIKDSAIRSSETRERKAKVEELENQIQSESGNQKKNEKKKDGNITKLAVENDKSGINLPTHVTIAHINISPPRGDTEKEPNVVTNDNLGTKSKYVKKRVQNRGDSAPVTKSSTKVKEKIDRSVSEKIFKISKKGNVGNSSQTTFKRPTKCIATKTINITGGNGLNKESIINSTKSTEVDINVKLAKSSREASPNKYVAVPVQTDDEINEDNFLHPSKVTEPDDEFVKFQSKITNVPIFQEETNSFIGLEITEVDTEKDQAIIKKEESEENERIINSHALEKADRKRNSIQIEPLDEEDEKDHIHLLSVSQKVNKFNEAVDELKKSKTKIEQIKKDNEIKSEKELHINLPQSSSEISKNINHPIRVLDKIEKNKKEDASLLKVSEKISKFTPNKIASSSPQKSPELVKNIMNQTSKNVKEKIENITGQFIKKEKDSSVTKSPDIILKSTEAVKRAREVFENNSTVVLGMRKQNEIILRQSVSEAKQTPAVPQKKDEESVTSAVAHEIIFPDNREKNATSTKRLSSDRTPIYMKDQVSTKKKIFEKKISSSELENEIYHHRTLSHQNSVEDKPSSPIDEVIAKGRRRSSCDKHYMQHTVASLEHVATSTIREAELQRTSNVDDLEFQQNSIKTSGDFPFNVAAAEILEGSTDPSGVPKSKNAINKPNSSSDKKGDFNELERSTKNKIEDSKLRIEKRNYSESISKNVNSPKTMKAESFLKKTSENIKHDRKILKTTKFITNIESPNSIKEMKTTKLETKSGKITNVTNKNVDIKQKIEPRSKDSKGLPLIGVKTIKEKLKPKVQGIHAQTINESSRTKNYEKTFIKRKPTKGFTDSSDFSNKTDVKSSKSPAIDTINFGKRIENKTKVEKLSNKNDKKSLREKMPKCTTKNTKGKIVETNNFFIEEITTDCCGKQTKILSNSENKTSVMRKDKVIIKNDENVCKKMVPAKDVEKQNPLNKLVETKTFMANFEKGSSSLIQHLLLGDEENKNRPSVTVNQHVTELEQINNIDNIHLLRKILEAITCNDNRAKVEARIHQVMADNEACRPDLDQLNSDLEDDLPYNVSDNQTNDGTKTKISSKVKRQGGRIIKTTTAEVIRKSSIMQPHKKVSPFEKFRQLDRQNSIPNSSSPRTPTTPTTPGGSSKSGPLFSFTDPTLAKKAANAKEALLQWAQMKTKEYENVNIQNFSTSWSDGLAFAALIHHFLPDAFDYSKLTPKERRHNFTLAFRVAEEKAGICPLLDVDDMVAYKKPDWKCVFCYVQSIYRRFKDEI